MSEITLSYTGKDFDSLKADLISKVPTLAPSLTNLNEGDMAMVLINMLAGVGDFLAFYIDRNAEELYLPTAKARDSLMRLTRLIDYRLARPIAAKTKLMFSLDEAVGYNIKIPKHTVARTKKNIYFTTKEDATLYAGNTTVEVEAFQGQLVTESFTSSGASTQSYTLSRPSVAQNFLEVRVGSTLWTEDNREADFIESGVYVVDTDSNGVATVKFSKHLGGTPGLSDTITVNYVETRGEKGNIGSGLVSVIVSDFTNVELVSVTNTVQASGGKEAENAERARLQAPRRLRLGNRAVTLQDFVDILQLRDGVAKASAINHHGYVEVYVAPEGGARFFLNLPTTSVSAVADAGSTLAAGTYFVRVTAVDANGKETADWEYVNQVNDATNPDKDTREVSNNEKSIAVLAGEAISAVITNVEGASAYRIYVGTATGEVRYYGEILASTTATTSTSILSLPATSAAAPPARNSTGALSSDGLSSLKIEAEDLLELRRTIGAVFALYNPTYVPLDITADVRIYDNYVQADVKGRVETALRDYLAFENQEFGETVNLSSLYQVVMDVEGVRSVSFTIPADDFVLNKGEIATEGVFTLTMTGGVS